MQAKIAVVRTGRDRIESLTDVVGGSLGEQFRNSRRTLEALLDSVDTGRISNSNTAILRGRSQRLAPIVADLKRAEVRGELTASLLQLSSSYVHMHINRMLRNALGHERMIYDFLFRLYEGRIARARGRPAPLSKVESSR